MTREEWLIDASRWLATEVLKNPQLCDRIKVTCGWPDRRGTAKKNRVIGQCWSPECSAGGTIEILVSPYQANASDVLETLLHEMIHAEVGNEHGHKKPFSERAKGVGFMPPWKSTPASIELQERLATYAATVPPYPHTSLDAKQKVNESEPSKPKPPVKCNDCGYEIRVAKKWREIGLPPKCLCGGSFEEAAA